MKKFILSIVFVCCAVPAPAQNPAETAAKNLLQRRVPALAGNVQFEAIPSDNERDVFELENSNGKLIVRGNNAVAMASGVNWFLKYHCNCQLSFRTEQLNIPSPLPVVKEKIRITTPYKYRYYFNYCCFSYTLAWWDWNDWERMIDLMAFYGVNAPLSVTGQEGVWRNVGKRYGLSDEQMQDFYVGPVYLGFGWMGCMDGWAGPLPNSWIDNHIELEKKIIARERDLGMTPILQGFTGHAPKKLIEVRPETKLVKLTPWGNFPSTYFIDPADPFFIEFGKAFVEEQTKLYGTNHLYASDTFIEMRPPSSDPAVLRKTGESIYEGMRSADPDAVWVLQGWIFLDGNFWKKPQRDAFLLSVPKGKLLCIDLMCEERPQWNRTESFSGQDWVWSIIQNFGGRVGAFGNIDFMENNLRQALSQPDNRPVGIGYIMEGLGYNPVIDDWQADMIWRTEVPKTADWLKDFVIRRYGKSDDDDSNKNVQKAWELLHHSVYNHLDNTGNNTVWVKGGVHRYGNAVRPPKLVQPLYSALKLLLDTEKEFGQQPAYQYDAVHLSQELLATLVKKYCSEIEAAYAAKDRAKLKATADKMDVLFNDIDRLLAANPNFLLGNWLESAKRWGKTEEERKHYEWNARTIITLWSFDFWIDDYSARTWSGMLSDYYAKRWRLYCGELERSLADNKAWDAKAFDQKMLRLTKAWGSETTTFPTKVSGENAVSIAKELLGKYEEDLATAVLKPVSHLAVNKPVTCSASLPKMDASLANDGIIDTDSFWGCDVKSGTGTAWWQVDLEKPETVGRVVAVGYYGDKRSYGFYAEGSLDGKTWTILCDKRTNKELSTAKGYVCEFPPQQIRFLRITQTSNSANAGRHLVEVLVFEK
ncbi:MAG: alpha-N-acetylglucosaminidase C-terminal domain-containing protein [Planctomycetaceae bacterium]|jgi:alpha-N-acetylglucosaminidase|nr:alpha-N-acetylglucosaminidase C-terminal domain-containing protein [Planctomycetaceae bacterium]